LQPYCCPLPSSHLRNGTFPPESQRCPSKWGAGDERGSGNHMKNAQNVLRGARLIKTGEVIELATSSTGDAVLRHAHLQPAHQAHLHESRRNTRGSNEEVVTSEIGQVGTQFDGFAHQSHGDSHYNCFKTSEIATRSGFTKLGVQNAPTFFTRGVLIDVAGSKGVEMLGDTYEITPDDLQQALAKQNLKLQTGDAVIIHTGWASSTARDNARFREDHAGRRGRRRRVAGQAGPDARRLGQTGRWKSRPTRTRT